MSREKTRVPLDKKSEIPDKNEVICPLVLMVTKKANPMKAGAVNYDLSPSPTIQLGDNEPGAWRSAPQLQLTEEGQQIRSEQGYSALTDEHIVKKDGVPQARSHSLAFYKLLEEGKKKGTFSWDEDAYYFTHEEGIEARKQYEQMVLSGETKARKRSWENRFEKLTGVKFEELQEKFPEVYKSSTKNAKVETQEKSEETEMQGEDATEATPTDEPTADQLQEIEQTKAESDETVAAITATEETLESEAEVVVEDWTPWDSYDSDDDASIVNKLSDTDSLPLLEETLFYEKEHKKRSGIIKAIEERMENVAVENEDESIFQIEHSTPQKVTSDCIEWKGDNGQMNRAYLVDVDVIGSEMWLPEGCTVVEDHTVRINAAEQS